MDMCAKSFITHSVSVYGSPFSSSEILLSEVARIIMSSVADFADDIFCLICASRVWFYAARYIRRCAREKVTSSRIEIQGCNRSL